MDCLEVAPGGRGEWLDHAYRGRIVLFGAIPAMAELVVWLRGFCEDFFHPVPPELMHNHLDEAELAAKVRQAMQAIMRSHDVAGMVRAVVAQSGLDMADVALDRSILRVQPPIRQVAPENAPPQVAPLTLHRDTWASNLYAQVNWWAPIYAINAGRTVAFYPDAWSTPLPNTSAEFDLPALMAQRKREHGALRAADVVPAIRPGTQCGQGVPLLIEPGQIAAFSGQHVHASIVNRTQRTRISFDFRTVSIRDVQRGRGAPNIDGGAPHVAYRLFRRASDGVGLGVVMGRGDFEPLAQP